eukprot:scaffold2972_cov92-Skeletonema_dohrnii-CCMP3373.AAC.5
MCCSTPPAEIARGGDDMEHLRLGDGEILDLVSESKSFDDDIEVLEEYAATQPSSNPVSCAPPSMESAVSASPTSQPSTPVQRRESLTRRLGINFQRPSARMINVSNKPVRQRVPSVRHEVDDNGYCDRHPDIQLYRRRSDDSGDWAVVRKKCPSCISKDCPNMLGSEGENNEPSNGSEDKVVESSLKRRNSFVQSIVDDFSSSGDQKILRAVGRTATVNAAVLLTAATGGVGASAIGYATGGAITAKRLSDGVANKDDKEVTKSLAVFSCATGASIAGQALTGALMIGVAGASLPVAGAVAFGVGCASGISAGALSEWTVDGIMDKMKMQRGKEESSKVQDSDEVREKEIKDEATTSPKVCT